MRIAFRITGGDPDLGIAFCWQADLESEAPAFFPDRFIPELWYDFFFIQAGAIHRREPESGGFRPLPAQALKTLHVRGLELRLEAPLRVMGARLALGFAENYWGARLPAGAFLPEAWVDGQVDDLSLFADQVAEAIRSKRVTRAPAHLLTADLDEAGDLAGYSPRHRRRLIRRRYGISRREMLAIRGMHTFLDETCDFAAEAPRIIAHIDAEAFYDQPHLNRRFRQLTGLSPLAYFETGTLIQENLMAVSYNDRRGSSGKIVP